MKYEQLTKEQFEELHEEFAQFLATQQIDANEWNKIKKDKPEIVQEELNLFSDVVWEDVLNKTKYLEHFSRQNINLFKCVDDKVFRIVVTANRSEFNFLNDRDYQWFIENTNDDTIQFFKGSKAYDNKRNSELFDLIKKGSVICDGKLYETISKLITL
jgi:hypothetical protein